VKQILYINTVKNRTKIDIGKYVIAASQLEEPVLSHNEWSRAFL